MMEPLISIIVPVYKVEEYLGPCVDSILAQTYQNIEVILVDDGSPDRCGEICDDYARQDRRVVVIHKKNGGLSDARNAGMEIAGGQWLMFVDSDDLLPPDAVRILMDIAQKEDAQLVIGGHLRFSDQAEAVGEQRAYTVMSAQEAMKEMFRNGCAAWARLYRRQIHEGIHYPVGEINEDEAIVLRLLERCTRVVKTEAVVYHYRCRPESITTDSFHEKKLIWPQHCAANVEFIRANYPVLMQEALARYRGSLLWALREFAFTGQRFMRERNLFLQELRHNGGQFRKIPFPNSQERISFVLLCRLPFWAYRLFMRLRHG